MMPNNAEIKRKNQESPYIIYSESTPNPKVMKFVANKILTQNPKEFFSINETSDWPLLKSIFSFPFVKEIFIANNYISIKKHDVIDWMDVCNQVRIFIQHELNNGNSICITKKTIVGDLNKKTPISNIELDIEAVIKEKIRPSIQMDGGDIELVSFQNGIVELLLKGACSGCPSSQITLKDGVETLLKEEFPMKVKEVIAINQ